MNRILKALAASFIAVSASAYTIKETKSNTDLDLYTSPSGTPAKAVSVSGTSGFLAALFGLQVNTQTQLTGALSTPMLQVDKTSNGTMMLHRESPDAGGATLEMLKRRSAFSVVSSGDRIATLAFSAADGLVAREAASVIAEVDGTPAASDMPGRLIFRTTADGSASPTERMRISQSGQISAQSVVGTNLQLDESTTDTIPQINVTQTSTGDAGIGFVISGSTAWNLGIDNSDGDAFVIGNNSGGNIGSDMTLKLTTSGDAVFGRSTIVPATGAVLAMSDSGTTELGFFAGSNGGVETTDTCTDICNGDRGAHGMSVGTGAYCVTGFGEAGGGVLTCSDATNLAKLCVCFGRRN